MSIIGISILLIITSHISNIRLVIVIKTAYGASAGPPPRTPRGRSIRQIIFLSAPSPNATGGTLIQLSEDGSAHVIEKTEGGSHRRVTFAFVVSRSIAFSRFGRGARGIVVVLGGCGDGVYDAACRVVGKGCGG
jgi:hypothetical protein